MWGHANSAVQKTRIVFIVQGILFAFVTNEINADVLRVCVPEIQQNKGAPLCTRGCLISS